MFFALLTPVSIFDHFLPAEKFGSLADVINLLSRAVAIGGGFLLVAAFVYTAYLYVSDSGDSKNIEKAKNVVTYAIIGMIIIATSYWITQIIAGLLGQSI